MFSVQPGARNESDEELGAIGVGASVGHGKKSWNIMLKKEVFIGKSPSVDGFASSAIMIGKVSSLSHEVGNDPMEVGSFVPETLLMGAKCSEVGCSFRGFFVEELENQLSGFAVAEVYFEEDVFKGH